MQFNFAVPLHIFKLIQLLSNETLNCPQDTLHHGQLSDASYNILHNTVEKCYNIKITHMFHDRRQIFNHSLELF